MDIIDVIPRKIVTLPNVFTSTYNFVSNNKQVESSDPVTKALLLGEIISWYHFHDIHDYDKLIYAYFPHPGIKVNSSYIK